MLSNNRKFHCAVVTRVSVVAIALIWVAGSAVAQGPPAVGLQSALGTPVNALGRFPAGLSLFTTADAGGRPQASYSPAVDAAPTEARPGGARRITLEEVKQLASASPAANPLAHLGQLSLEAAKQHRLGAQADYFPKISATAANLHYSEFLGQVVSLQRPVAGSSVQVPVPLFNQNQTFVAVTFVQPITPLFQVYQLVKIARADERIAMAKAGVPIAKNASAARIEEAYFKLLIAQRKLVTAEWKHKNTESRPLYASTSIESVRTPEQAPELVETTKVLFTERAEVKELTASLNRLMGWPDDTELELVPPAPLVENISFEQVAGAPVAANPEIVEAEQTAIKARAASVLSKLAYMPTVGAVSGFIYQNVIPLVPNTFGYGGVMVTYNLFDFGKREHAVKEASAQLGMAEIAVQLTKAKVASNVKTSYSELERTRQFSQMTQNMGSSVTRLMNVSSTPESLDMAAARANVEAEMFEADFAHRQAYARLKALIDPQR